MKITLCQKPRGIAIFIVMISILVLAAMAGILAYNMRVETQLAMNSNNEAQMEWAARSGIERARWLLGLELQTPGPGQRYDALNQAWAGGHGETNDLLSDIPMKDVQLDDDLKINVTINDTEQKLNINSVANNEALMTQALIMIGVDASEIPTIIGSIQDWIDVDDETHVNGAESDYYGSLNPPYRAKNGPIDDISELLLIKGITPDIYWGPNSTNHPPSAFHSQLAGGRSGLLPNTPAMSVGLVDMFTPISSGLININTCKAGALRMLGMDPASADRIISLRQGPDGMDGTDDDMPFSNPGEIINAGLPNQIVSQFMPYLTVRSSTFEVQVEVFVGTSPPRRYHSILRRNSPRDIQVLGLWWD